MEFEEITDDEIMDQEVIADMQCDIMRENKDA